MTQLKYLSHYPASLQAQIQQMLLEDKLGHYLQKKYPESHTVQNNKALYDYAVELKQNYLKNAAPIDKVIYDNHLTVDHHALGLNTAISRVQGGKLKAKKEIRIAALFKNTPAAFLRMIVVHELAHLKERDHNKAFYQLCEYMEPNYHQLEFDLRVYLTYQQAQKAKNL
ncbi:MAG: M48 family metallopeptidase [Gammaproteobacteria bacterium]|nr:M48 family metallopeptidase [Gammaproteobacteria bacterium]